MAETISDISSGTHIPAEQEGAVFVRSSEKRTLITRTLTTTEAVQAEIIKALKDIGVELNQTDAEAEDSNLTDDDAKGYARKVTVISANTEGLPDRLQVEPPLWTDELIQLSAKLGGLVRLYVHGQDPEPKLIMPKTVEQASTEQIAA